MLASVLIVDDDRLTVEQYGQMLTLGGYRALKAYSAGEGMDVASREHPDMIPKCPMAGSTKRKRPFFACQ
jgi:DNA-binding response OmpR family regulator